MATDTNTLANRSLHQATGTHETGASSTAVVCTWEEEGECYTLSVNDQSVYPSEVGWELKNGSATVGTGSSPGSVSTCGSPTSPPSISPAPTKTFAPTPYPTVPCDIEFGGQNDGYKLEFLGVYSYVEHDEVFKRYRRVCSSSSPHTYIRTTFGTP